MTDTLTALRPAPSPTARPHVAPALHAMPGPAPRADAMAAPDVLAHHLFAQERHR
ncbi:hypothetical protein FHR47_004047 [Xanthomonas arboricola]|uniref:hypothetical protein n=1 Tax=Xanthomonas cannabis TaxID=1885674 RepID=UPI000ADC4753|nr:hypothetical protein [Xanthomonas cannabis]MBB3803731.1 hypothetical protein [Xanthomonas cannabis]NIK16869.1 hypothetical protein [Xanthomonas cannabis]